MCRDCVKTAAAVPAQQAVREVVRGLGIEQLASSPHDIADDPQQLRRIVNQIQVGGVRLDKEKRSV